ncbi:hypothetical protein [Deinococcus navajonensis]|uniref:Uncharacterized protein n=1 Tax=Deinococcus navajonensis TaxID=309884 RepID=A0ABV8XPM9_9DEIO
MTVLDKPSSKRPVTFDIQIPADGPRESDFESVASMFAHAEHKKLVLDTPWRRVMSVFGLFYIPNKK